MTSDITRGRLLGSVLAAALVCAAAAPALAQSTPLARSASTAKAGPTNNAWIVQMADMPVTAYTGGISGLRATKPGKGQKVDPNAPAVVSYMGYLASRQDAAMASVGASSKKLYSYGYVFNGFAAELTEAQAQKLARMPGVLAVSRDEIRKLDTATTPEFLGLTGPGGFWATKATGENVVIGIVDSGVWPENPSFSDRTGSNGNASKDGKLAYRQIPGWNGRCVPGEAFAASNCNQKLIGARYFNAGFGGNAGVKAAFPYEFNSPRDADGHGSHTASTAGGNANVSATGPAAALGTISGIAPRARIAVYKTCWGNNGEGGCPNSDNVAAIDQAVADGVDVINYSISGTRTNLRDPVEIAFLFAADAGVFVAASAGNSGPAASTVAHPSPWITTVAAGTHNRQVLGSTTVGNGERYEGASTATSAVGPAPFIYSGSAGQVGANPSEVALCYPGTLDASLVRGKIVLCDRGVIARTDKSVAVAQAGGVGMVLVNVSPSSLNADFHSVPTVHVAHTARAALLFYAGTPGATASIAKSTLDLNVEAPFTASFSSRGPLLAAGGDLLKPDLIAPGVDILAAVSPIGYGGRNFDLLSGTSMSSPHVAGLAALMKELKPDWSPMAIKSALMTTAYDTRDASPSPFLQGAGHVQPMKATDPGLVFDSGFNDWRALICATQPEGLTSTCDALWAAGYSKDASDMNVASIAIGAMAGKQTVKRTVTNVSGNPAQFTAVASGLAGIDVSFSPATLSLAAGKSKDVLITFTNASAALNAYQSGSLTWSNGTHEVRIPVVVRPVALAAPSVVTASPSGTSFPVTFGYTGAFNAAARGLVAAQVTDGNVTQDPDQTFTFGDLTGTVAIPVTISAGTTYSRFALFDADVSPGADIDVFVYQGSSLVGSSRNGTSAEEVNFSFANPTGGPIQLTVFIHGWGLPAGNSTFKLHQWSVGATGAGNMTVTAPASATIGATATIGLSFSGLTGGTKYLGSVVYGGPAGLPGPTIVRVDAP